MSNRLGGRQGTAYLGTNANNPPNLTYHDRPPTQYDTQNVSIGDFWINRAAEPIVDSIWQLVSLQGNNSSKGQLATWVQYSVSVGALGSLTGNSGGSVGPSGGGNINIIGDGTTIDVVGNPGTNTLTISATGSGIEFPTDSGIAIPESGLLNVNGGVGISTSGSGDQIVINNTIGVTWVDLTSASVTMAANTGYVIDNGSNLVTLTLPSTAAFGTIYAIAGYSSGGWKLGQEAGQIIHYGSHVTTSGTAGYLEFTNEYDSIELICVVANTTFVVRSSIGNIIFN